MSSAKYNIVKKYVVTARCIEPMHIGSGESDWSKNGEILTNPQTGIPFIQATGIAGAFGEYAEKAYGSKMRRKLFGDSNAQTQVDGRSKLIFSDGVFNEGKVQIELRSRVKINGKTGTVSSSTLKGENQVSGHVFNTEYISADSEFTFCIYYFYKKEDEDVQEIDGVDYVNICLQALHTGAIHLGGQASNGCGRVEICKAQLLTCDLTEEEGRKSWAEEASSNKYQNITEEISDCSKNNKNSKNKHKQALEMMQYQITLQAVLGQSMLVRGEFVDEDLVQKYLQKRPERDPDTINITNGNKEFIIPASSIKGAFRSRIEAIIKYLKIDYSEDINNSYNDDTHNSKVKSDRSNNCNAKEKNGFIDFIFENRSKIYFYDAVIDHETARNIMRTHINKLSGSVMDQALFSEMPVNGKTEIRIVINKSKEDTKQTLAILGLVLYAIRDLAIGAFSLGGGSSVGRGFVSIDNIQVMDNGQKQASITGGKIHMEAGNTLIEDALQAVGAMCGGN